MGDERITLTRSGGGYWTASYRSDGRSVTMGSAASPEETFNALLDLLRSDANVRVPTHCPYCGRPKAEAYWTPEHTPDRQFFRTTCVQCGTVYVRRDHPPAP